MHFLALSALVGAAFAQKRGFNYGATTSAGAARVQQDFENEFNRAKNLQGQSGFTSARLYTMIQGGTVNTATEAIPAAIDTQTTLLLGLWGSAGQAAFDQELTALSNAIKQYGSAFTNLIDGISIGSEDLYRITPTGIENNSGVGAGPDVLVSYISQVRDLIKGTAASGAKIGHVDTWTAWVNGSNTAVINAVDWLGMDGYPYYQTTLANGIENAAELFFDSYNATVNVAGGKPVWITETGWPYQGPQAGQAVASVQNAETYWQAVACRILGNINTWWFTLNDPEASGDVSFSVVGPNLNDAPLYNLACSGSSSSSRSSTSSSSAKPSSTAAAPTMPAVSSGAESFTINTKPNSESAPATVTGVSAQPTGAQSQPAGSSTAAPSSSAPAGYSGSASAGVQGGETHTVYQTTMITVSACSASYPPSSSAPAPSSSAPAPSSSAPAPSSSAPASSKSAPAPSSSSSGSKSCPTTLTGDYQYPHLIVPVSSSSPDKAYGTSYNGTITPTESTIFNFDIPASYAGKTCSLVFLFPNQKDLQTSAYSFNGKGGLKIEELSGPADAGTTYANAPKAAGVTASITSLVPGNSYTVFSHACGAGQRVAFEFESTGGLELNFFEDYNPSPLGAYITAC
ncbi:glycoside hydrolase family 17 [Lecanosticta acicola]|uniref:Glycoside hydrolase family 17 n=1 Tax=Lecanosticta acicola TaxID=111012 RepID=A0AAI8Z0C5_9PEZI|nr:glycoside hydrolase family 17 [Lecanosticta acicola]